MMTRGFLPLGAVLSLALAGCSTSEPVVNEAAIETNLADDALVDAPLYNDAALANEATLDDSSLSGNATDPVLPLLPAQNASDPTGNATGF